ncbi:MAG: hypothetical protein ACREWI_12550, partial [Telluria sp.]
MRKSTRVTLLLALSGASALAGAGTYSCALAVDAIRGSIAARNCSQAVDRLKSGLKNAYPEVILLAGSMYENGVCVKRDWSQAVTFYVQAHEAGEKDAAARLAAGYADPANGSDVAAALWWGLKALGARLGECAVPKEAMDDPDRFVAALATWPAPRLAACNYLVGVMSTMKAEVKYPELAIEYGIGGEVSVRFLAGVPRIELQRGA